MRKYRCVRQHDIADCGPACLATIAGQYGLELPLYRLRSICGTDRDGTNMWGLAKCAEKIGFDAKGVKGDAEAFMSGFPVPAIAHVVIDRSLLHYVVVQKVLPDDIIISDPAKGVVHYKPDDFFQIWTGNLLLLKPNQNFKKGKCRTSPLKVCLQLAGQQKGVIFPIFLLSLPITAFGILGAFYYQYIMEAITREGVMHELNVITGMILLMYLVMQALSYCRGQLIIRLSNRLDQELIFKSFEHVLRLPMGFYENYRAGEIVSRFTDAARIRDAVSEGSVTIMMDAVMAAAGGVILFRQNRILFSVALVILALYGLIALRFAGLQKKSNERIMEDNSQFMSHVIESISGEETIKACTSENEADRKAGRLFGKLMKSVKAGGTLSNRQLTITGAVSSIGGLMILWIGTCMAMNGRFSMGELMTFVALLSYFLTPIQNIIDFQPSLQAALVSVERLHEILETETEEQTDTALHSASEEALQNRRSGDDFQVQNRGITFSKVNFRYGTRDLVLHDIDLRISPGEKLAIIGESGCGKTTLTKLLMRFYDFESGNIRIGDTELRNIPIDVLRRQTAYVSQRVFLFTGSIRDNLTMGRKDIPDSELDRVCGLCCLKDFIRSLPLGYDTFVGERGDTLSGGQKQRIAIARALLRNPSLLILDEATSSLDLITENMIRNTLNSLPKTVTVITIAHRLSTIQTCDRIVVMEKGRIADIGSHDELIRRNGIYKMMWSKQEAV